MGLLQPHGRHRAGDGQAALSDRGRLLGIARHARARAPIEVLDRVAVTVDGGIDGDFRGSVRLGKNSRQVSLMEATDWAAAMAAIGAELPWWTRRANLLVDFDLPHVAGTRLRIGEVVLEITKECDPCFRMDEIAPGLRDALRPDWRGGALAKVVAGGAIATGDEVEVSG